MHNVLVGSRDTLRFKSQFTVFNDLGHLRVRPQDPKLSKQRLRTRLQLHFSAVTWTLVVAAPIPDAQLASIIITIVAVSYCIHTRSHEAN